MATGNTISSFGKYMKTLAISLGLTFALYFSLPYFLPTPQHTAIAISIILTTSNVIAIILSWIYFSHSRCYDGEGNITTVLGYKIVGASATHLIVFIARVSGNIITLVSLLPNPAVLTLVIYIFGLPFKWVLFSSVYATALYIIEMGYNVKALAEGGLEDRCNDRSLLCKYIDDPLFCDF